MTADQAIAQAAARAAVAYRNGDDILGAYWEERVVRLSDARELARMRDEHAYIHSAQFEADIAHAVDHARLRESIARLERHG